jgi:hypothetical protein
MTKFKYIKYYFEDDNKEINPMPIYDNATKELLLLEMVYQLKRIADKLEEK